jgi:hypothetical protein
VLRRLVRLCIGRWFVTARFTHFTYRLGQLGRCGWSPWFHGLLLAVRRVTSALVRCLLLVYRCEKTGLDVVGPRGGLQWPIVIRSQQRPIFPVIDACGENCSQKLLPNPRLAFPCEPSSLVHALAWPEGYVVAGLQPPIAPPRPASPPSASAIESVCSKSGPRRQRLAVQGGASTSGPHCR